MYRTFSKGKIIYQLQKTRWDKIKLFWLCWYHSFKIFETYSQVPDRFTSGRNNFGCPICFYFNLKAAWMSAKYFLNHTLHDVSLQDLIVVTNQALYQGGFAGLGMVPNLPKKVSLHRKESIEKFALSKWNHPDQAWFHKRNGHCHGYHRNIIKHE